MIDPTRLIPLRHRFVRAVREWFDANEFCEVETPIAVASPGMEPHLRAFELTARETSETHHHLFMHTSPEYHMKRVLARHQGPIFQICRCFRDEPVSRLHRPEFTMLEWYRTGCDYRALMDDLDNLLEWLAITLLGEPRLRLPEGELPLNSGCERLTVREAMLRWAGVDPWAHATAPQLASACVSAGLDVPDGWPWEDIFHFALLERVEGQLGADRPTILMDYPVSLAALSRVVGDHSERFELYIAGHELANAFSELVDPDEQRRRFELEQQERAALGRPIYPVDEGLIEALGELESAAGIALGLDRLWLLFAEHELQQRLSLDDVLFVQL